MGANNHQTIETLYSEQTTYERYERYPYGGSFSVTGREIPGTRKTTRTPLTVEQVWDNVRSKEGYEDGHSYSGNFAVKPGFVVFGKADVGKDLLLAAGTLVASYSYSDEDPFQRQQTRRCTGPGGFQYWCNEGKVIQKQQATLADGTTITVDVSADCPVCFGTGRRAMTGDEQDAEDERLSLALAARQTFGEVALRRAVSQFDDKWGDAVALVGTEHVWFGGMCSS